MQSLSQQFRRGNAVMVFNTVTKQHEVVHKRGTDRKIWRNAIKDQDKEAMMSFCQNVTKPITKEMAEKAEKKGLRHIVN